MEDVEAVVPPNNESSNTGSPSSPEKPLRTLESFGVVSLKQGEDQPSEEMFHKIGFLDPQEFVSKIESITQSEFGGKDYGGGWCRGGSESFYNILRVATSTGKEKLLAFKALHSMGDMQGMASGEALRLALLHEIDRAPRVYAIAPATIIREYLSKDKVSLPEAQLVQDANLLFEEMTRLGITIDTSKSPTEGVFAAALQHNGRLKVFDAGSGDFSGPSK